MPKLGVNIDHVATLRQARGGSEPDPIIAAKIAESAGADSIVVHLREDRRHIQDKDLTILRRTVQTRLNLEMSINSEIVNIACKIKPDQATLVPEKRHELTTEGGLDAIKYKTEISKVVKELRNNAIVVSLFIDPVKKQIEAAEGINADSIELHTGEYANSINKVDQQRNLRKLINSAKYAHSLGLVVNVGHGLNYSNVKSVAKIHFVEELNIGHSIIACAVFKGLHQAVKEMKELIS